MKERVYETKSDKLFCPNCHRKVNMPFKGNINITGKMNINCSCGGGRVIIKGKKEEDKKDKIKNNA
jgi:DNA-directed RNA polymerase subunit RPC12/RpoP